MIEQDENTKELAEIIMSDYLIEESVLYGDVYYHKDECNTCDECGEEVPECGWGNSDEMCNECWEAMMTQEDERFDYNAAIRI